MRTRLLAGILAAIVAVLAAASGYSIWRALRPAPPGTTAAERAAASHGIAYIFVIVEENKPAGSVLGSPEAPYVNDLIQRSALATAYVAVTHPSLPNYLALTSGSTHGITADCSPRDPLCQISGATIADRLEAGGRTWKAYAESMPQACGLAASGDYAPKHNPFVYYDDVRQNAVRCRSHDVPLTQLSSDLQRASATPDFALITPNMCDDGHDCSLAAADAWLAREVPSIVHSPAFVSRPSLLVITWDEGNASDNRVLAVFAGSAARNGYVSAVRYDHYSLLHTIEAAWGLQPLTTHDARAPVMNDLLR